MEKKIKQLINFEVLSVKIDNISQDVLDIKSKLERQYITREEFDPIKKIVYGFVGIILVAVATAIVALVLKGKN